MWKRNAAVFGLVVTTVALAGACSEGPPLEPRATENDEPQLFRSARIDPASFRGLDAHFVEIAQAVPGFGGAYYDEAGRLNVVMAPAVAPLSLGEVQSRLATHLQAMGQDPAAVQTMVVQEGEYDFVKLDVMHRRVMPVLGMGGTVSTDVDEVRNRVVIGVENRAVAADVANAIAMLGVPSEAVIIELAAPIQLEQTLRDRVRPVVGGLQINFPGFLCTHGFNVRSPNAPNVHGFVTNSHCSSVRSEMTETPYWQPTGSPDPLHANFIGREAWDVPPTTGGACPVGRVCRWSDALGARYAPGVENTFGGIARTTFFGEGATVGTREGSLIIDPANPRWQIVDELPFPLIGQIIHKTGRTNGWTRGPVTVTCQTVNVGGSPFTLFCQDRAFTWSAGGDSGSPYFERIGETNQVRLVGIHWGSDGAGNIVMSAMKNVRCENEGPAPYITFPGQPAPATPVCPR